MSFDQVKAKQHTTNMWSKVCPAGYRCG